MNTATSMTLESGVIKDNNKKTLANLPAFFYCYKLFNIPSATAVEQVIDAMNL